MLPPFSKCMPSLLCVSHRPAYRHCIAVVSCGGANSAAHPSTWRCFLSIECRSSKTCFCASSSSDCAEARSQLFVSWTSKARRHHKPSPLGKGAPAAPAYSSLYNVYHGKQANNESRSISTEVCGNRSSISSVLNREMRDELRTPCMYRMIWIQG